MASRWFAPEGNYVPLQMTRKLPLLARRKDGVNSAHAWPIHLRIDVEGDELQVLKGAQETLRRYRPMVFLSTHGPAERAACCQLLSEMGYKLEPAEGDLHSSRQILCRAA